jgi:ATP-dependent RNA helicase RhlE
MTFNDLNLIKPILDAVHAEGYEIPTPIQQQAIPYILDSRDILGCAQTGTGKTAAFALPILQLLSKPHAATKKIRTLILTPTRELAIQIEESFATYGKGLRLKHTSIFGGVPQGKQVSILRAGIDILIATPGRLLDLMQQGFVDITQIEIFVLDEADRMLDMGFIHDVKKVVVRLPAKRQTLFFSATMPESIQQLANTILRDPASVTVTPVSSTAERVSQSIYFVEKKNKTDLLIHVLRNTPASRSLVFTRTKHGADKLVKQLERSGINAAAIHGNKSQNARQKALADFKAEHLRVLVATDIAARGIDIDELPLVINYEIPEVPETYVHRIGRTGRAGFEGTALSFCDHEEIVDLKAIQKLIGVDVPVATADPYTFTYSPQSAQRKSAPKPAPARNERERRDNTPKTRTPQTVNKQQPTTRQPISNDRAPQQPRSERKPAEKLLNMSYNHGLNGWKDIDDEDQQFSPAASTQVAQTSSSDSNSGVVTYFSGGKGYGFIKDEKTNEKVFVHVDDLAEPVTEKDRVSFDIEQTSKGPRAVRVTKHQEAVS